VAQEDSLLVCANIYESNFYEEVQVFFKKSGFCVMIQTPSLHVHWELTCTVFINKQCQYLVVMVFIYSHICKLKATLVSSVFN